MESMGKESRKWRKGYCPFQGLGRDREFSVATEFSQPMLRQRVSCHGRFGLGRVSLGHNDELKSHLFLVHFSVLFLVRIE